MEHEVEHEEHHTHQISALKKLIFSIAVIAFLIISTIAFVAYGKGYRLGFQKGEPKLSKTGLLHITSSPQGAQVYVDGHLTTAANNTISLTPGKYTIKITKDGYNDWQKDIQIEDEVVSNADAVLYPKAPTLQSISTVGVESVVTDPSATKLAFKIASKSARQNGIYIFDMSARPFPVLAGQSSSTQIVDDTIDTFSNATIIWSPDGKEILASTSGTLGSPTYYLLKADGFNSQPQDVTATLSSIQNGWKSELIDKEAARLSSLKQNVQKFAAKYFHILSWSPDETKILYQSLDSTQMPIFLKPRLIGNNLLYERRDLQKGAIYVYDISEDVNTRILDAVDDLCTPSLSDCKIPLTWLPDSSHFIYVHDKKIEIVEDDGANTTTIYAGPFVDNYVFPWPDGSKIVILTNLNNTTVSPTLYTIGLK